MKCLTVLVILFAQNLFSLTESVGDIQAIKPRCEYLDDPLAVDNPHPRLSWIFYQHDSKKQNLTQKAFQIIVATTTEKLNQNVGDLWDTTKVLSDRNNHIKYAGTKLGSGQRAYWKVRVWDQNDQPSPYSSVAFWVQGLQINDWTAQWIGAPAGTQQNALKNISDIDSKLIKSKKGLVPVLYLRKHFTIEPKIKSAKIFSTALGAYKVMVNDKFISHNELSPGWTDYHKTIQYQGYDVTSQLNKENAIGVILGTGWYSSYVGFAHHYDLYGTDQKVLLELHIEYENKTRVVIKTDSTWKVTTGPLIYSDLLMGELFYENRLLEGWATPQYNDKNWLPVVTGPIDKKVKLVADRAQPVRVTQELRPKMKYQSSPGVWVFDFEQNMVGWVRVSFKSDIKPSRIQIRHAEVLQPNGAIYTQNLRSALATDTYLLQNDHRKSDIHLEPHFTFHGFRYIEISGFPGEPKLEDFVGRVVGTDIPLTGKFRTSNTMVNKLHENIVWGQRGNFLSVPTDCPQRDERLGWTGDGQVFAPTATYNAEVAAFYTKWMRDLREGQSSSGGFSDVAPRIVDGADGAPAWGDAGVIVPYTVYRMYGDLDIIEENYEAMKKWIDYILSVNPNFIWTKRVNNNFGDWLSVGANTPKEVLSTAYFAYDSLLLSKMADAINRKEDGKKYRKLHSDIANTFVKTFVDSKDGKIKGDTQTAYLVALAMELLPAALKPKAVTHLVENIKAHKWHLTTGFVGVGYISSILTQYGHNDVAYRLLLQDTYPSWGYSIKYNATTIWERWDGWTKDKGFQNPGMNSFNHYSLGSVGRWMLQSIAGIDTDEEKVGFKKIIIKPNPGNGLTFVDSEFQSINGVIKSSWNIAKEHFILQVTIPVNTRAVVDLRQVGKTGGVHEVGSGTYNFNIFIG